MSKSDDYLAIKQAHNRRDTIWGAVSFVIVLAFSFYLSTLIPAVPM